MKRVAAVLAMVLAGPAMAGKISDAEVAFESGNWSVRRSTDMMTDEVVCTGIYKDQVGIQLSEDTLYVTVLGGLQGYVVRFGDDPAEKMRLPDDDEKAADAISFTGAQFARALGSSRLRIKALTYRTIEEFDLDMTGIEDAVASIRSGCPSEVEPPKSAQSDATTASGSEQPGKGDKGCGTLAIAKLVEKGVTPETIAYACGD